MNNVQPPPAKKLKSEQEHQVTARKYDAESRCSYFQDSWSVDRLWLVRPKGDEGMKCSWCVDKGAKNCKIGQRNAFVGDMQEGY